MELDSVALVTWRVGSGVCEVVRGIGVLGDEEGGGTKSKPWSVRERLLRRGGMGRAVAPSDEVGWTGATGVDACKVATVNMPPLKSCS